MSGVTGLAALMVPAATGLVCGLLAGLGSRWLPRWVPPVSGWRSPWPVALIGALLGAGAGALTDGPGELLALSAAAIGCALLVVVDLAALRLPDPLVGGTLAAVLLALTATAAATGAWGRWGGALLAGLAVSLGYLVLALVRPADLGLGDVKLAAPLGVLLGWFGRPELLLGVLAGFAASAVVAAVLLISRRAGRKASFPFGPCMVAGAAVGLGFGPALLGT